jgi:hypothetical protein
VATPLHVDPERRRQRIGVARGFYTEHGFAADGAVKRDAHDDAAAVRMQRALLGGATEHRAGR